MGTKIALPRSIRNNPEVQREFNPNYDPRDLRISKAPRWKFQKIKRICKRCNNPDGFYPRYFSQTYCDPCRAEMRKPKLRNKCQKCFRASSALRPSLHGSVNPDGTPMMICGICAQRESFEYSSKKRSEQRPTTKKLQDGYFQGLDK